MTPDAVEALHEVATSTDRVAERVAELSGALLSDQQQAREEADVRFVQVQAREDHRFRTVNRALAGLGVGLVVALLLLATVVVLDRFAAADRDTRSAMSTRQRECSDVVTADVLGRLSSLAVQPRYRTNPDGSLETDTDGHPIPLSQAELLAQSEVLRREVERSNRNLTRISDVCYAPGGPDPTPLDGDPTR